ncbi:MAG: LON peptidase substrate-binding domain-containing protein [Pyrinomonadaceae bacterium]
MSEAFEKVLGIRHLPIFPLPLVLLPNELLPLHIFEERYRKMLTDVEADRRLFGITLFDPPEDFIEKPETGTVGCVAEVREAQTLPDGRSNILTIGLVRYRLNEYIEAGEPYLVGDIEFFEDDVEDASVLNPLADEVFILFRRIARAAHKLSGERGIFPDIPQAEPEQLSFLVTAAFNLEPAMKYRMVETRSTIERLTRLREILVQAVDKMEDNAEISKIAKTNGHSKKKIDI